MTIFARHADAAAARYGFCDEPVCVVLISEQSLVRKGLRLLLEGEPDIEVVGDVAGVGQLPGSMREPDAAILDTSGGRHDVLRAARHDLPDASLLVLSSASETHHVSLAFASGARGYLLKEAAPWEFVEAVRKVARGEPYVQERLGAKLARWVETGETPPPPESRRGLSPREREVLTLLAQGHTNAEIAETLHVSTRTVEAHRLHILQKLSLRSRAEIVRYAQAEGLL